MRGSGGGVGAFAAVLVGVDVVDAWGFPQVEGAEDRGLAGAGLGALDDVAGRPGELLVADGCPVLSLSISPTLPSAGGEPSDQAVGSSASAGCDRGMYAAMTSPAARVAARMSLRLGRQ